MTERTVTANIGLTLDGRYNGPGGPGDMQAIVRYATTEVARDHLTRIWEGATTAYPARGGRSPVTRSANWARRP
ncbi:hypothetical protein ACGFIX_33540 [Nocardia salmonicida]|uniref:hypothetical protein n=1 Tax=Nocardia salmonicida TaxID=53431 RepID=UPI0037164927